MERLSFAELNILKVMIYFNINSLSIYEKTRKYTCFDILKTAAKFTYIYRGSLNFNEKEETKSCVYSIQ